MILDLATIVYELLIGPLSTILSLGGSFIFPCFSVISLSVSCKSAVKGLL